MTRLRIFVADDDRDDYEMLAEAFQRCAEPPEIEYHENGAELLLHLNNLSVTDKPDLVVLDLNMPKVDGIRALRKIKGDAHLMNIPVFMHSTSNNAEQVTLCKELGAAAYFVKGRSFTSFMELAQVILDFLAERETIHRYTPVDVIA